MAENTLLYSHLVKPLEVKAGPPGLYPTPRIWADGNDWEGFNGHFSYGFLREAGEVCHPVEGAVVHPYDEILVCAGSNFDDILDLGGEMSIELGEEREEHVFDKSQMIIVPKGTPHGALKVRNKTGDKAIAHFLWALAAEYEAENIPAASLPAKPATGTKYAHLVRQMRSNIDPLKRLEQISEGMKPEDYARLEALYKGETKVPDPTGMGYVSYIDEHGVVHPNGVMGPGNADQLLWLFGEDLQNLPFNFLWTFASKPGVWHTEADGHYHPDIEVLLWVGFNPDDLLDLGARCAMFMGPEFEGHMFKVPTAVLCPPGFIHLPEVTLDSKRTFAFMMGCMGEIHEAPWVNLEDFE